MQKIIIFIHIHLIVFSIFLKNIFSLDPTVDVALNKPIIAEITCGVNGSESFYSQRLAGIQTSSKQRQVCENKNQYPAQNINDNNDQTFWQSTSRINFLSNGYGLEGRPDVLIFINLQQEFEIKRINIKFGESQGPGKIAFYKTTSKNAAFSSNEYTPWFYRVRNPQDCKNLSLEISTLPNSLDQVPCTTFSTGGSLNEQISFDFSQLSMELQAWSRTKAIKIEFYDIPLILGVSALANEFQHYTIRTINVFAKCSCNNQQQDCLYNNETKSYNCLCGNNTMGRFCESCLPLYNNKPYQSGIICEACNCNNNSESCSFESVKGKGVCNDCQNFTSGDNCESCLEGYYLSESSCLPCECNSPFSTNDCVKIKDEKIYPQKNPGDCICKPNIVGQKCDKCQEGFYKLDTNGCKNCSCDKQGTLNSSILCDETGQCFCKLRVSGIHCDQCKDGFYNLDLNNDQGCLKCGCDLGGASSSSCLKTSGQCTCRDGIGGLNCDSVNQGYFIPNYHFLFSEFETLESRWSKEKTGYSGFGYVDPIQNVPVFTKISMKNVFNKELKNFNIVLRFKSSSILKGTLGIGPDLSITSNQPFTLEPCASWCFSNIGLVEVDSSKDLFISITFSIIRIQESISLDKISAIPSQFLNATQFLGEQTNREFVNNCKVLENGLGANPECKKLKFSVISWVLNGGLPCGCNSVGSNETQKCETEGGQCYCKSGVKGRTCQECQENFYNLNLNGCQSCNCSHTVYNMCDKLSGECLCPPGTSQPDCSRCQLNYYNWDLEKGCIPCDCNILGSEDKSCNISSGMCRCKEGVEGLKCDQCEDGYYELSEFGCKECLCDMRGSVNNICDKTTGNCVCKKNVMGMYCDTCKQNAFSLELINPLGCTLCLCMGISDRCYVSNYIQANFNLNPTPSEIGLITINGQETGMQVLVDPDTQFKSTLINGINDVYWTITSIKGSNVYLYGSIFNFNLLINGLANNASPTSKVPSTFYIIGTNEKKIGFKIKNFTFMDGVEQTFSIKISEEDADGMSVMRKDILLLLADIKAFLIPAVLTSSKHKSSIRKIKIEIKESLVEECICPSGYEGSSCQICSQGFKRTNVSFQGFLGNCEPCDCNGMAIRCDPNTGDCLDCQNFTTGNHCESCLPGYYKDPNSQTCFLCPCFGPRVQTFHCQISSELNSSVYCVNCSNGYYGDLCQNCEENYFGDLSQNLNELCKPCGCNNRSSSCDKDGKCLNCSGNTTGDKCQDCLPGMYMKEDTCTDCTCNEIGSLNFDICDPETGDCSCKPGIGDQNCSRCLENYYGFSHSGCSYCNCSFYGSKSGQCKDDGTCECLDHTLGDKCNQCEKSYYGLSVQKTCQICNCSLHGIVVEDENKIVECSETGQCQCKENVIGKTCSSCKPFFFSKKEILECEACDACETSIGQDLSQIKKKVEASSQLYINKIFELEQVFEMVHSLDKNLSSFCTQIESCERERNLYSVLQNNLTAFHGSSSFFVKEVFHINDQVEKIKSQLFSMKNKSDPIFFRLQTVKKQSKLIQDSFNNQQTKIKNYISQLQTSKSNLIKIWESDPYNGSMNQISWNKTNLYDQDIKAISTLSQQMNQDYNKLFQLNNQLNKTLNWATQMEKNRRKVEATFQLKISQLALLKDTFIDLFVKNNQLDSQIIGILAKKSSLEEKYEKLDKSILTTNEELSKSSAKLLCCQKNLKNLNKIFPFAAEAQTTFSNLSCKITLTEKVLSNKFGFISWNESINSLSEIHNSTQYLVSDLKIKTSQVEQKAQQLTNQASNIISSYELVKSRDKDAVEIIENLQDVINKLRLEVEKSKVSQNQLYKLLNTLNSVQDNQLNLIAETQLNNSANLQEDISFYTSNASSVSDLNEDIKKVDSSFQQSFVLWQEVDAKLDKANNNKLNLDIFIKNLIPKISENQMEGITIFENLNIQLKNLDISIKNMNKNYNEKTINLSSISKKIDSTQTGILQKNTNLSSFKNKLMNIKGIILKLNSSLGSNSSLTKSIDSSISNINENINRINLKFSSLEMPIYLQPSSYVQVENPNINENQIYNIVSFQFSFPKSVRGILFFVENTSTKEKILIQLINSSFCVEFSNIETSLLLCADGTVLYPNIWYEIMVTRFGLVFQLTLKLVTTGEVIAFRIGSLNSVVTVITLNSPIYIGGLSLSSENYYKVYDMGVGFTGCIYKVSYNELPLPFWQKIIRSDSSASCCKKPLKFLGLSDKIVQNCIRFPTFGYILFSKLVFDMKSHIRFSFRTFAFNGVIFIISNQSISDYFGLFIKRGKLILSFSLNGVTNSIASNSQYTGFWSEVSLFISNTTLEMILSMENGNQTETKKLNVPEVDFKQLNETNLILGGQNPNYTRGPYSESYSGMIKNFMIGNSISALEYLSLNSSIFSENVYPNDCSNNVESGLGSLSFSYVKLVISSRSIQTLQFTFITESYNGILFYGILTGTTKNTQHFFCICLFNGDILLIFNQGKGVQPVTRSRGLFLGDNKKHKIHFHFGFNNSPRIKIDSLETHVGAVLMDINMNLLDESLYVFGVPSFVPIDQFNIPTKTSLAGGITELKINDELVNFYENNAIEKENSKNIYLSGVKVADKQPDSSLSFSTFSCIPLFTSDKFKQTEKSVYEFNGNILKFDIKNKRELFKHEFTLELKFRTLKNNGVLFHASNENLSDCFFIYLQKGLLKVQMTKYQTIYSLSTEKKLSDGLWHEVIIIRIGNFMALHVKYPVEFKKNNEESITNMPFSNLSLGSFVYFGAIPKIASKNLPLPFDESDYHGCLGPVSLKSSDYTNINFNQELIIGPPPELCSLSTHLGMMMTSADSYMRVSDQVYSLTPGFSIYFNFKFNQNSGLVLVAMESKKKNLILYLDSGKFKILLGSYTFEIEPFNNEFRVCDNKFHSMFLKLNYNSLKVEIDESFSSTKNFNSSYEAPLSVPIYFGAWKDLSFKPSSNMLSNSIQGCVQNIEINNEHYNILNSPEFKNVISGCI